MSASLSTSTKLHTHCICDARDLLSEKTPSAASRTPPRPLHAPASAVPLALLAFLNPLSGSPVLSFSPCTEHRPPIASNAPTMHRVVRGRVADKRGRRGGERSACAGVTVERRFASAAERTGADSLCTHSRCYFRPTRRTAARRRYRSSFAPLFHARSILRPSRDGLLRRNARLIRDCPPVLATLLIPSPNTKRVHPFTVTATITLGRLFGLLSLRVSPVSRVSSRSPINAAKLFDRSIDRRFFFYERGAPCFLTAVSLSLSFSLSLVESAASRH